MKNLRSLICWFPGAASHLLDSGWLPLVPGPAFAMLKRPGLGKQIKSYAKPYETSCDFQHVSPFLYTWMPFSCRLRVFHSEVLVCKLFTVDRFSTGAIAMGEVTTLEDCLVGCQILNMFVLDSYPFFYPFFPSIYPIFPCVLHVSCLSHLAHELGDNPVEAASLVVQRLARLTWNARPLARASTPGPSTLPSPFSPVHRARKFSASDKTKFGYRLFFGFSTFLLFLPGFYCVQSSWVRHWKL